MTMRSLHPSDSASLRLQSPSRCSEDLWYSSHLRRRFRSQSRANGRALIFLQAQIINFFLPTKLQTCICAREDWSQVSLRELATPPRIAFGDMLRLSISDACKAVCILRRCRQKSNLSLSLQLLLAGIEPASQASEAYTLSIELQEQILRACSTCPVPTPCFGAGSVACPPPAETTGAYDLRVT